MAVNEVTFSHVKRCTHLATLGAGKAFLWASVIISLSSCSVATPGVALKPPPREEVLKRFLDGDEVPSTELQKTISVCQPILAYYADRSILGERVELTISFSGLLAGVAGAALIAASPANAVWAAGLSAYAGATNAASDKLSGSGLQGEDAAKYRAALVAAVTRDIGLALDAKSPEESVAHFKSAQTQCVLELGPAEMKFGGKLQSPVTPLLNYDDFTEGEKKETNQ